MHMEAIARAPAHLLLPLDDDVSILRRRVPAELAEVREELRMCQGEIIADLLTIWCEHFGQSLRHRDIRAVIQRFVVQLEAIFSDPMRPERPFPAVLFGRQAPRIVQFMIRKMLRRDSIFFSETILRAQPAPIIVPHNLQEQLRMLQAISIQREREEEKEIPALQELRNGIRVIEEVEENNLRNIGNVFRGAMDQIEREIMVLREQRENERIRLQATAARLQAEIEELRIGNIFLQEQLREAQIGINEVRREHLEIDMAINLVETARKKKQSSWVSSLLSLSGTIGASWALSQVLPGSTFLVTIS